MKLHERIKAIQELQEFEVPWEISHTGIKPVLFGGGLFLTDGGGDSVSLDEAKQVISWLAEQLGGTVKWPKGALNGKA